MNNPLLDLANKGPARTPKGTNAGPHVERNARKRMRKNWIARGGRAYRAVPRFTLHEVNGSLCVDYTRELTRKGGADIKLARVIVTEPDHRVFIPLEDFGGNR